LDIKRAKRISAQQIHTQNLQVFAWPLWKSDLALDEAGNGLDPRLAREDRPERFVDIAADFQLGLAGDEIDASREGVVCAVIRNLDREIDGDAQGDAKNIQHDQQRVPLKMADDVPNKDAWKLAKAAASGKSRSTISHNYR
jgi:hypothetical protein